MNYLVIYNNIIKRGKSRILKEYSEKHHIIPKCMNGSNAPENIVALTPREHFLCHMLLFRIYPEESKLLFAINMMMRGRNKEKYKISSRKYELLKMEYSEMVKKKFLDKSHPLCGSQKKEKNGFFGKTHSKKSINLISKSLSSNNPRSRKILDTNSGIIYKSINDAAESKKIHRQTLLRYLSGKRKNKTTLVLL